jgi:DNA ligase-4
MSKKYVSRSCFRRYTILILALRYFFHATPYRAEREEYNLEDEDIQVDAPMIENEEDAEFKIPDLPEDKDEEPRDAEQSDIDPSLADWFKVEQDEASSTSARAHDISDNEIENDSDNEDLRPDEEEDDWLEVKPSTDHSSRDREVRHKSDLQTLFLIRHASPP